MARPRVRTPAEFRRAKPPAEEAELEEIFREEDYYEEFEPPPSISEIAESLSIHVTLEAARSAEAEFQAENLSAQVEYELRRQAMQEPALSFVESERVSLDVDMYSMRTELAPPDADLLHPRTELVDQDINAISPRTETFSEYDPGLVNIGMETWIVRNALLEIQERIVRETVDDRPIALDVDAAVAATGRVDMEMDAAIGRIPIQDMNVDSEPTPRVDIDPSVSLVDPRTQTIDDTGIVGDLGVERIDTSDPTAMLSRVSDGDIDIDAAIQRTANIDSEASIQDTRTGTVDIDIESVSPGAERIDQDIDLLQPRVSIDAEFDLRDVQAERIAEDVDIESARVGQIDSETALHTPGVREEDQGIDLNTPRPIAAEDVEVGNIRLEYLAEALRLDVHNVRSMGETDVVSNILAAAQVEAIDVGDAGVRLGSPEVDVGHVSALQIDQDVGPRHLDSYSPDDYQGYSFNKFPVPPDFEVEDPDTAAFIEITAGEPPAYRDLV